MLSRSILSITEGLRVGPLCSVVAVAMCAVVIVLCNATLRFVLSLCWQVGRVVMLWLLRIVAEIFLHICQQHQQKLSVEFGLTSNSKFCGNQVGLPQQVR